MNHKIDLPPILRRKQAKTLTVGAEGSDICGFTSRSIQTAVDALRGVSGQVVLTAEEFTVSSPIRLYDGITLCGKGAGTVLRKIPAFHSALLRDADYGELIVTVAHPEGFSVGDGVVIYDKPNANAWGPTTARITEIRGNTLTLDAYLERDYNAALGGIVSNACSVIEAVGAAHVTVKDLTVDAIDGKSELLSSCRGGGIYCYQCEDVCIDGVTVKDFGGDGISTQMMEGVTVHNCEVFGSVCNGIHPGAGSYGVSVTDCRSHDNGGDGLFVCWRVIGGTFRNNRLTHNKCSGINIGHKDTDNLFEGNICADNEKYGLHLRAEREDNAPHRCVYRHNDFQSNLQGPVKIESPAKNLIFEENAGFEP